LDALVDETLNIESLVAQTNVRGLSILPAFPQALLWRRRPDFSSAR